MFPQPCSVRFPPLPFALCVFCCLPWVLQCHCCEIPNMIIPEIILLLLSSWLTVTGNSHMKEDLWKDHHLYMLPLTCSLFFSSCHSSLLLNLSFLLNLICVFPLLLDWRHLQSSCSAYSKRERSILLPSSKSSSSVRNVSFSFKSLLPLILRWGPHFSAQLWTLGLGENWHCCHLSLNHQSHLCLDLENFCSLS